MRVRRGAFARDSTLCDVSIVVWRRRRPLAPRVETRDVMSYDGACAGRIAGTCVDRRAARILHFTLTARVSVGSLGVRYTLAKR